MALPRAVAIVPARLAATRLPRKMLLGESGAPLFAHTVRNAARSGAFARIVLATDADEILRAAREAGIEAVMTRVEHNSGTDRVAEAWNALAAAGERADVVVNVQGDEPELEPADLAGLVRAFADASVEMGTLAAPLAEEDLGNPAVVKVVCDAHGDALYFSRAPIPFRAHGGARPADREAFRHHLGVYGFRPSALARFCALPPGRLAPIESLEQLRWLEAGNKLRVVAATRASRGIDTREDYERFVERVRGRERTASR